MHHVREFIGVEKFRDDYGVATITQHADFYRGDIAILGQYFELLAQFCAGSVVHGLYAFGALHRKRSDGRHAVATVGRESFQVRSDAGSAGGIESRRW